MILPSLAGYAPSGGSTTRASSNLPQLLLIYCSRTLLDRRADFVSPLGPGTIVISDLIKPEQIGKHKPGMTGALSDPAINDRVCAGLHAALVEIDFGQLIRRLEGGVVVCRGFPRHALGARN